MIFFRLTHNQLINYLIIFSNTFYLKDSDIILLRMLNLISNSINSISSVIIVRFRNLESIKKTTMFLSYLIPLSLFIIFYLIFPAAEFLIFPNLSFSYIFFNQVFLLLFIMSILNTFIYVNISRKRLKYIHVYASLFFYLITYEIFLISGYDFKAVFLFPLLVLIFTWRFKFERYISL